MGPQQLRLERHQVPVAGRQVDDALEIEVVLDAEGDSEGAHPHAGHRRVADVDAVGAGRCQEPCGVHRPLDPDRARRVDLHGDDVAARPELLEQRGGGRDVASGAVDAGGRCGARGLDKRRPPLRAWAGLLGRSRRADRAIDRGPHRGDVGRRGPAAAADDPGAGCQRDGRDLGEPVRVGRVDELPLNPLRQPRVRHERAGQCMAGRVDPAQGVERGTGPDAAVDPERVGAGDDQQVRGRLGCPAVGQAELLAERHRGDDREVRRGADLGDRQQELVQVVERLEDEQVDAALQQPIELLAEGRPRRRVADPEIAVRRTAQRADRPANERIPAGDIACLAGQLRGPSVQARRDVAQAPAREPDPVRTEGRRLDEVGPGVEVLPVDRADQVGPRENELVEAGALRDPPGEEQGPGRAVGDERASGQTRPEAVALRCANRPGVVLRVHRRIVPRATRRPSRRVRATPAGRLPTPRCRWPQPRDASAQGREAARGTPQPRERGRPGGAVSRGREAALATPVRPGTRQPRDARLPRRRARVRLPSASTNTSGGRGRPLYAERIDAP